ncbi:murein hydrolase activator EnvC family protein [Xanthomonas hortorum]|uniref:Peptidase M23 n=4 Tax=Xanthomonas hortorum TaxID=56454 RepID=A0AAW9ZV28_9XANT|nr:peptidoglycan DD-metalloendopeptidase family protein [Xanthomonas hortorum]MCE4355340.1 peptidoglycan DD-metalloendopeptidase family protein [Xanthomonas hortorum pv. pelargonii]MCM5523226.1 peptidoglycan DD-metalloendopeptidase family protein [Xanthomonas hortorum pv. pelargonii]MCM5535679.1 peptidoglycan DD-metalloendopeptidase family protein [Xanthomonas hortorum pv. pelargonii]MCM5539813.1 peptidoglycan DD-metalloendopeptidase family protein [Xanthomonas hortorum pv. pelargonii]MCM55435
MPPSPAPRSRLPLAPATGRSRAWLAAAMLACALLACTLLGSAGASAQSQREAERKLQQLRDELKTITADRRELEGKRGTAAQQLRQADEKVAKTARALSETESAMREQEQHLGKLQQDRAQLQRGLQTQRVQLAALLRAADQVGRNAPLKVLLSQDTVGDATRRLADHRYVQNARAQRIQALTTQLEALAKVEQDIASRRQALDSARAQQKAQASSLQKDRSQQAVTVAQLDDRYKQRAEREKALGQDAKSLEQLLANLRAAAAKAEAERRAAAKRAAAEAAAQAKRAKTDRPDRSDRPGKTPPKVIASAPAPKVGGLSWPVSGNLLARFNATLPDGHTSKGVLIGAPKGSTVSAVADGTVVFSDWMTGYGMILIVDHGNGYMSLYAHNDTLLRDAGASIKRGEAVAKVGSSGGQGVPALYFELRRNGQPVDPSSWLQRR